jgi:prolyl 4-hydroxylase
MKNKYKDNFIGQWDIDKSICDEIINYFENNKKYANPGYGAEKDLKAYVDTDIKESLDLKVGFHNFDVCFNSYRRTLQECLNEYLKLFEYSNNLSEFDIVENFQIQKYPVNGGFKKWHFENTGTHNNVFRHLVFMTYLNDVDDGGTEFYYQKIKTKAEKGLTLIWPATWTHTHRGIVSSTKEKYIITGWFSFKPIFNALQKTLD